jgi:transposase
MAKTRPSDPNVIKYFSLPDKPLHRQYIALRSFLFDGNSAEDVAEEFGYTVSTVYTLARDFKAKLLSC